MIISSRDNPRIKEAVNLASSKKARIELNKFVGEGFTLLEEAISAGILETVFCLQGLEDKIPAGCTAEVFSVTAAVMDKLSSVNAPPGTVFICRMPECIDPVLPAVAVENLSDPGNMGTVIRTAEAFGFKTVITVGNCTEVYSPKVVRSAMGSLFRMNIVQMSAGELRTWADASDAVLLAAALTDKAEDIRNVDFNRAIPVIGNEAHGLTEEMIDLCHKQVIIPISGIQSLNAAVAASVFMWEAARKAGE